MLEEAWRLGIYSITENLTLSSTFWTATLLCCGTCRLILIIGWNSNWSAARRARGTLLGPRYSLPVADSGSGGGVSGGSYASTHDPRLHFGLGEATSVDMVEVHWPSGAKEKFAINKPDQIVTLVEGKGAK